MGTDAPAGRFSGANYSRSLAVLRGQHGSVVSRPLWMSFLGAATRIELAFPAWEAAGDASKSIG